MICPNCRKSISNTAKFCNYCGEKLTNDSHSTQYSYSKKYSDVKKEADTSHEDQYSYSKNFSDVVKEADDTHLEQYSYSKDYSDVVKEADISHMDQYSYSELYSNVMRSQVHSEEDYIRGYIGSNYENVKRGNFSISALFFGPLLLLYHRMWTSSILFLGLIGLIGYYNQDIALFTWLMVNLFLGFRYHSMYYEFAQRKVDEIKISNPDKTSTELLDLCKKKGTPFFPIIPILFFGMIALGMILPYLFMKSNPEPDIETNISSLSYTIPLGFQGSQNNNDFYKYYYFNEEDNDCTVIMNYYQNTKLDSYIKNYYQNNSYQPETINNWNWRVINNTDTIDYLIEINEDTYKVRFIYKSGSFCKNNLEIIKNSLDFPEIDQ